MNFLNYLPPFFQNEIVFFASIAIGLIVFGGITAFLYREIRGRPTPPPSPPSAPDGSESVIYRGSAGATRTMDSSPSGILGAISRGVPSRLAGPGGTSIVAGSNLPSIGGSGSRDQQIEPELRMAGYYRPGALAEYKSVRALLIVLPLVVAAAVALFTEPATLPAVIAGGFICSALGYSIPRVYVNVAARRRRREIERGLPAAIDMIVLGLVAGQNIMNSFQRVSLEIRRSFPVLSEEMQLAYRQAELNTLGHSLRVWGERSGVQEIYNLAVILTQSERQGADVSNSLLEFASSYRVSLRQRADAQANRASFWMLFPTLLCMWIPAAVILAAPVYFDFAERRAKTRESLMPPGADAHDPLDKRYAPFLKGTAGQ